MTQEVGTFQQLEKLATDMVAEMVAGEGQSVAEQVDSWEFGDLKGRLALVADLRREARTLVDHAEQGFPVGDGYGLFWRLALLQAYDKATAQ